MSNLMYNLLWYIPVLILVVGLALATVAVLATRLDNFMDYGFRAMRAERELRDAKQLIAALERKQVKT